jgi:hypothetical protein
VDNVKTFCRVAISVRRSVTPSVAVVVSSLVDMPLWSLAPEAIALE